MKSMRFLELCALGICLFGAGLGIIAHQMLKENPQLQHSPGAPVPTVVAQPATPAFDAPVISTEGRVPVGEKIDPATIGPNNGVVIDVTGDGIADFVIVRENNSVYYAKGKADGSREPEVKILTIKGDLIAYNLQVLPGQTRPSILFWDKDRNGYVQTCLGINETGIPYFGEIESLK